MKEHCVKHARSGHKKPVFWHILRNRSWKSRIVSPASFSNQWNVQSQLWLEYPLKKNPALAELPAISFSLLGHLLHFHYIIFQSLLLLGRGFSDASKNLNGLRMQISVLINSNHRYQIIISLNTVARKDAPVFLRVWEVVQIVLNFAVVEIFVKIKNFSEYKFFEENYYFIRSLQEF